MLKQKVRSEECAMAPHKRALAKDVKRVTERSPNVRPFERSTVSHSPYSSEEIGKVDIQDQPILQDPVIYKMVKDLAKEVETMKREGPRFPPRGKRQGQWKGNKEKEQEKDNTVPKQVNDDAKRQSSDK